MNDDLVNLHARIALEGAGLSTAQIGMIRPKVESALRLMIETENLACERLASEAADEYFHPGAKVEERFILGAVIAAAIRRRRRAGEPF